MQKFKRLGLLLAMALALGACSSSSDSDGGGQVSSSYTGFIVGGKVTARDVANSDKVLNEALFGNSAGTTTGSDGTFAYNEERAAQLMTDPAPNLNPAIIKFTLQDGSWNGFETDTFKGKLEGYLLEPGKHLSLNFVSSLVCAMLPNPASIADVKVAAQGIGGLLLQAARGMGGAIKAEDLDIDMVLHGTFEQGERVLLAAMTVLLGNTNVPNYAALKEVELYLNLTPGGATRNDLLPIISLNPLDDTDLATFNDAVDAALAAVTPEMRDAFAEAVAINYDAFGAGEDRTLEELKTATRTDAPGGNSIAQIFMVVGGPAPFSTPFDPKYPYGKCGNDGEAPCSGGYASFQRTTAVSYNASLGPQGFKVDFYGVASNINRSMFEGYLEETRSGCGEDLVIWENGCDPKCAVELDPELNPDCKRRPGTWRGEYAEYVPYTTRDEDIIWYTSAEDILKSTSPSGMRGAFARVTWADHMDIRVDASKRADLTSFSRDASVTVRAFFTGFATTSAGVINTNTESAPRTLVVKFVENSSYQP